MNKPRRQHRKLLQIPFALLVFLLLPKLAQSQDLVSIISPTGTEEQKFGESIPITWANGDIGAGDRFVLYYSVDGGSYILIAQPYIYQLTNSGNESTYNWTIPDLGADSESEVSIRVLNQTRSVSDTSESFRVYYEPSVSITSPAGIEEQKFGESIPITWANGDIGTGDRFVLYYSVDGGSYILIAQPYIYQLTNSGNESTYNWTIPDLGADSESEVSIRVLNQTRSVSDTSESFRVYYEPSVSITSPAGIEEQKFGESIPITWANGDIGTGDRFVLYYSVDGGSYILIAQPYIYQLTNSGNESTYNWTIPDLGADSESEVSIRVLNQTRSVSDTSESFRVYYEPSVSITSPNGIEEQKFGESIPITWANGDIGTGDRFVLYYSVDGGSYILIAQPYIYQLTNSGNESTYNWTIPDLGADSESEVSIRVLNQTRSVSDTSESFRVYYEPSVSILSPTDGAFVPLSASYPITWANGDIGTGDRFFLYYSVDGGSYILITQPYIYQLTNSGGQSTYNWTTPATGSSNVKLRVWNQTRNVEDITESFVLCDVCPGVSIYTPNGGEVLYTGQTKNIGWNEGGMWADTDNVVIEFSADGGSSYSVTPIYSGTYDGVSSNSIDWVVPPDITSNGKIRITNSTQSESDVSNGAFSIQSAEVTAPTNFVATENGNATFSFSWTDNEDAEQGYRIEYSTDKADWTTYANLAPNTQTYTSGFIGSGAIYWWRAVAYNLVNTTPSNLAYAGNVIAPGNALKLDGIDDYVSIPHITPLSNTQKFSIETWAKFDAVGGFRILFCTRIIR